jgi:benzoyl-CoA reductase/2-hydroxyglutaryl-CoA dehydratase subunit BcrC/BadD/HgdB
VTAFEVMKKHYRERDLAAREFKEKGGKVVGYMCDSVPEEMILAAGFFPLRISGDPWGGTELADKYTETAYEGFVRSMLNMILNGAYDFLDFLIIPHSRDSIHELYAVLNAVKSLETALRLPDLYIFDTLHTKLWTTELYNRDRVYELKKKLEEWSENEITSESLSRSIAVTNENRKLLKKIARLRSAEPPRISGVDALQIIGSSMFMLKEDHNELLKSFLDGANKLAARNGVRLFFEGSPVDNVQFYELVESSKATIVAEDNCWGNRYSDGLIDRSLDPVEAIASRYHLKSPCPRMYPLEARVEYCLQSALEAKVQGVVFNILDWDYAQTWEHPDEKKALEEHGIPTLSFKNQKYLISNTDKNQIKMSLEQFIEAVKRRQSN